jgi:hypothetical protein
LDFKLLYLLSTFTYIQNNWLADTTGTREDSVMATMAEDLDGPAKASTKAMEPEKKNSTAPEPDNPPLEEDVPDPEEDDLDDLDGEFVFNLGLCYN